MVVGGSLQSWEHSGVDERLQVVQDLFASFGIHAAHSWMKKNIRMGTTDRLSPLFSPCLYSNPGWLGGHSAQAWPLLLEASPGVKCCRAERGALPRAGALPSVGRLPFHRQNEKVKISLQRDCNKEHSLCIFPQRSVKEQPSKMTTLRETRPMWLDTGNK